DGSPSPLRSERNALQADHAVRERHEALEGRGVREEQLGVIEVDDVAVWQVTQGGLVVEGLALGGGARCARVVAELIDFWILVTRLVEGACAGLEGVDVAVRVEAV